MLELHSLLEPIEFVNVCCSVTNLPLSFQYVHVVGIKQQLRNRNEMLRSLNA